MFNSFLLTFTRGYSLLIFRLRRCSVFVPLPAPRWFHVTSTQEPEARTPQAYFLLWVCLKIVDLQEMNIRKYLPTTGYQKGLAYFQTHVTHVCCFFMYASTSNYFGRCGCHEGHSHSLRLDQEVPETGLQEEIHQAAEP